MKCKNKELIGIVRFLNNFNNKKLPQKIAYAIIKNNIIFSKEYSIYEEALKKIYSNYRDSFIVGKDNKPIITKEGIPIVADEVKEEFKNEIAELLQIEIEINPYTISESYFDYEDAKGIYDALTPMDSLMLINLICQKEENEGDSK